MGQDLMCILNLIVFSTTVDTVTFLLFSFFHQSFSLQVGNFLKNLMVQGQSTVNHTVNKTTSCLLLNSITNKGFKFQDKNFI